MSSLKAKDRASLCSFTFADGRRSRTPRLCDNSHFCPYHAQKEARARATQKLGKDLAFFFSGDYLSACDLSTALGRLIPAVVRGDVKPRAARTVAYLAQTLLQAIHLSKHEYTNAFGSDGWRQSIRNSVRGNYDYRFPPAPKPQPPAPHLTAPTVGAVNVAAGRNLSRPGREPGSLPATPRVQPAPPTPQPAQTPVNCHSERSEERPTSGRSPESYREEAAFSLCPAPSPASTTAKPLPTPATHPARSAAPAPPPVNPPQTRPTSPREPNRDAPWLDFTSNIRPDSKLL